MDGVGAAPDVAFERLPCLFPLLFLRSGGFLFPFDGCKDLLPPIAEFLVAVPVAFVHFFLPAVIKSAPSRHHRVGAAREGRELGGQLLPVGGDIGFPFPFRHELQVVVQLLPVNHDVRFSANLRIEGTPGVCVAGLFPHILQIARMFECYGFPVFEVTGMQFIPVFWISVQMYKVVHPVMLLSEMERYGRMVRTLFPDHRDPVCVLCGKVRYLFFPDHRDPVCVLCGKVRYLFFPDLCCCCFSHNHCFFDVSRKSFRPVLRPAVCGFPLPCNSRLCSRPARKLPGRGF